MKFSVSSTKSNAILEGDYKRPMDIWVRLLPNRECVKGKQLGRTDNFFQLPTKIEENYKLIPKQVYIVKV
jgi:hypothetical protein